MRKLKDFFLKKKNTAVTNIIAFTLIFILKSALIVTF